MLQVVAHTGHRHAFVPTGAGPCAPTVGGIVCVETRVAIANLIRMATTIAELQGLRACTYATYTLLTCETGAVAAAVVAVSCVLQGITFTISCQTKLARWAWALTAAIQDIAIMQHGLALTSAGNAAHSCWTRSLTATVKVIPTVGDRVALAGFVRMATIIAELQGRRTHAYAARTDLAGCALGLAAAIVRIRCMQ